ncbi:MAG: hypothetical protein KAR06_11360, partial [Deltaproteobacteria bacterium]|nr:hypothetical protein [Deltaproteobacteria bacterium]
MAGGTLILNFEESHLGGSVVKDKSKEALADVRIEFDEGSESRALKNVLEELQEMGHSEFSFVMTTLPPRVVSLRNLDLPFEDKSKAEQILSFELADKLPWDINEMECACITPGGGRTIAAAVKKEELVNYLNVFKDAGVEPNWIGVALFSKELLLSNVEGGMLGLNAFIDSNSIVASRDGNPVFFKNYNSDDELRFSIASLESRYGEIDRLFSSNGAKEKLSSFERTITSVDSFSYDGTEMASLKFQYEKGLKDTVNFRRGEFAFTERTKEETRSLKVGVVLLTLCLVLWLAFFAVKYTSIQSHSAAIDGSIANSYSE